MLSRIAESLFWIGRYLERAEDTSRLLEVHQQLLLEDPVVDPEAQVDGLLAVMGIEVGQDEPRTFETVLRLLAHDPGSPCSIAASVDGAREAARRARETVSTDMWEAINTFYLTIREGDLEALRPREAFKMVRERCAIITAMADNTMSHDQGWQFLVLGRNLERADMTARMISSAAFSAGSPYAWQTTLRACGAHHAFTRYYQGRDSDRAAAEFLIVDRLFPRSIVFALTGAETALGNLDVGERRAGFSGDASRELGRARAELEYTPLEDVVRDLPGAMRRLEDHCGRAGEAIAHRYFEGAAAMQWHGGAW
ncbi:MAG: alpha-E domain-containing protein [Tetrasphaera sp.]